MNNRFKFRVWYHNQYLQPYAYLLDSGGNIYWTIGGNRLELEGDQSNFTVEQWTGLKDKNGTEIYECDILGVDPKEGSPVWYKPVIFENGAFRFNGWTLHDDFIKDNIPVAVAGNIHQNPELLK